MKLFALAVVAMTASGTDAYNRYQRASGPQVSTSGGDLVFAVKDSGNVVSVKKGNKDAELIELKSSASTIEAIKLGYSLGKDLSQTEIIRDLTEDVATAKTSVNEVKLALAEGITTMNGKVDAATAASSKAVADAAASTKVSVDTAAAATKTELRSEVKNSIDQVNTDLAAAKAQLAAYKTCSDKGQALSAGKCVALEPPTERADKDCTKDAVGITRYVKKSNVFQLCAGSKEAAAWVTIWVDFSSSKESPISSCKEAQDGGGKSGMYYLAKKGGNGVSTYMYVYCLLSDKDKYEDGGWMLVMANLASDYMVSLTNNRVPGGRTYKQQQRTHWSSWPKGDPSHALSLDAGNGFITQGLSVHLDSAMDKATQIMYTDSNLVPFLAAEFVGGAKSCYWPAIQRQTTGSQHCQVNYFVSDTSSKNSWSNTWESRGNVWIEACASYPWGHRQGKTHFNDGCGGAHICWEDENIPDRPFAYDHCSGGNNPSWCPVYGRGKSWFQSRGGKRRGSMKYMKWLRWA